MTTTMPVLASELCKPKSPSPIDRARFEAIDQALLYCFPEPGQSRLQTLLSILPFLHLCGLVSGQILWEPISGTGNADWNLGVLCTEESTELKGQDKLMGKVLKQVEAVRASGPKYARGQLWNLLSRYQSKI